MPEDLIKKCENCQGWKNLHCIPSWNYSSALNPSYLVTSEDTLCRYPLEFKPKTRETSSE